MHLSIFESSQMIFACYLPLELLCLLGLVDADEGRKGIS